MVDRPLTEYLRYELAAFADNVAAGEEIFVPGEADPKLAGPPYAVPFGLWMSEHRHRLGWSLLLADRYAWKPIATAYSWRCPCIHGMAACILISSCRNQSGGGEMRMADYEVLASDCPPDLTCPKVARAVSGRVVVVGRMITGSERLSALGVGCGEGAVEITEALYRAGHDGLEGRAT